MTTSNNQRRWSGLRWNFFFNSGMVNGGNDANFESREFCTYSTRTHLSSHIQTVRCRCIASRNVLSSILSLSSPSSCRSFTHLSSLHCLFVCHRLSLFFVISFSPLPSPFAVVKLLLLFAMFIVCNAMYQ